MTEFDEIRARLVDDAIADCQEAAGDTGAMLRAVSRLRAFTEGETADMAKGDSAAFAAFFDNGGSMLHGSSLSGSGTVRSNAGVGRKGKGKTLSRAEAKKLMRQQVAKEKKLAAEQTRKQNAAAKRAARAQARRSR